MEALAAVGLVASLVQFLDVGARLVSQSLQLYRTGQEALIENLDLEATTKHLKTLNGRLSKGAEQDDDEVLQSLCASCQGAANELLIMLSKLKKRKNDSRKWVNVAVVIKSIWHKDDITSLARRLAGFRAELNLHVSFELRDEILQLRQAQPELLEAVDHTTKIIVQAVAEQKDVFHAALATQFQELKDMQVQVAEKIGDDNQMNQNLIKDINLKLESILAGRDESAGRSVEKVLLENLMNQLAETLQRPAEAATVDRDQLRSWLNPVSTEDKWQAARNFRVPGTSDWILQRDVYKDWSSDLAPGDPMKFFWLHGGPGFGKTMLCASILEHLKDQNPLNVAYFFCVSDDEARRQPSTILRSWISQIADHSEVAREKVSKVYKAKTPGSGRNLLAPDDVWSLLKTICQAVPGVFLVVDGFDECIKLNRSTKSYSNEAEIFLEQLVDAAAEIPAHLLLVSREDPDVRYHFRRFTELFPKACFEHEIAHSDTEVVMRSFADRAMEKKLRRQDATVKSELAAIASQRSGGMFLWVQLLVNRLQPDRPAKELRKMVSEAPVEINIAYENDLKRIMNLSDERDRAIGILRWTFYAQRPLTVRELTEAMAVDLDDDGETFPADSLPDSWLEEDANDRIRRLGGALIELRDDEAEKSPASQTVHFVHFSVIEFLSAVGDMYQSSPENLFFRDNSHENCFLSRICLRYVNYNEVTTAQPTKEDDDEVVSKTKQYGFLKYASSFWFVHARNSNAWSDALMEETKSFFYTKTRASAFWSKVYESEKLGQDANVTAPIVQPDCKESIYYASLLGFGPIVKYLLEQGASCDAKGPYFGHALTGAAARGYSEVVQLLLDKGADVNAKDDSDRTALGWSARYNMLEVAKMLISHKADPNAAEDNKYTPLHRAASSGYLELVQLFVENGADVTMAIDSGWTAVHLATRYGHTQVFDYLMANGATINHGTSYGWTELHLALYNSHRTIAEKLIAHGAKIDAPDGEGLTPLNRAAATASPEDLNILLEKGAEIDSKSNNGWTPIYTAAENGRFETVKFFFEHGAKPDIAGNGDWTAIHIAARDGKSAIVEYLFKTAKVDIDLKKEDHWTPLHLAVHNGHLDTVKLLIENGANMEAKSSDGQSVFHLAAGKGEMAIVNLLLGKDVAIDTQSSLGRTPLYAAAMSGHVETVKLLLSKGQPVETTNKDGWQPLHIAAFGGHLEVVKVLLEHGAGIDRPELEGWHPIHCAAQNGHTELIKHLLDQGALLEAKTGYGGTAIYIAASNGHNELVEALIDRGGLVNYFTNEGWTSLHRAGQNGHVEVLKTLIKHGADVNAKFEGRTTPIFLAAQCGQLEAVKLLREKGATMILHEEDGWNPLHGAAEAGHKETVEYLLTEKLAEVDEKTTSGRTALYLAAGSNHPSTIEYLLTQNADINAQNPSEWTPLHIAASNGHLDTVKTLVSHGAPVDAREIDGWYSLYMAAHWGHLEVVKYLVSEQNQDPERKLDDGRTCLFGPANRGHLEVVKYLVEELKVEVNAENNDGWTPLMNSAQNGHTEVTTLLLEHSAKVDVRENANWTPLQLAAQNKHLDIVKMLVERGAVINEATQAGWTPLHRAAYNNHIEMLEYLIMKGANLFEVEKDGWTALHLAAQEGHLDIMKALIMAMQGKIDGPQNDGWTPLYTAIIFNRLEAAEYLLEQNPNVDLADNEDQSPLFIAILNKHFDFARKLVTKGHPNVNAIGTQGRSPLYLAIQQKDFDFARFLVSEAGADVNIRTAGGMSPLSLAAEYGQLDLVKFLLDHKAEGETSPYSPPYYAAIRGHVDILTFFLDREPPANINDVSEDGQTFMYGAAANSHIEVLKLLISRGAEMNTKTRDGWNALHTAAESGDPEVIRLLLDHGAAYDPLPSSPLYVAASHGKLDTVKVLRSHKTVGSDVELPELEDKDELLTTAIEGGHVEVVEYFHNLGAKIETEKDAETTPLFVAVENKHLGVIKYLVQHNADVHRLQGTEGFNILHLASASGALDLVEYLIEELKFDVEAETKHNFRALHVASYRGHLEVVKYLIETASASVIARNYYGNSAMHCAVFNKETEVFKYLLSLVDQIPAIETKILDCALYKGIDEGDCFGNTLLHQALASQNLDYMKLLLEAGANPTLTNGYGVSVLDMVDESPELKTMIEPWAKESKPKGKPAQLKIARQTIQKIVRPLLLSRDRSHDPGLQELGNILKLFGDFDAAKRCGTEYITKIDSEGKPVHDVWCADCMEDEIVGSRFVCKTCPDVDLCGDCMAKRDEEVKHLLCKGHEFIEVTAPDDLEERIKEPFTFSDDTEEFLQQILVRYGDHPED